ncbi:MAG: ribosome small subunit-dependent GTPase A [Planctomycetaceae bacterium]|jgi:ribosome biogenesis GTPase / thiamine phosphate phosphatase|nr:ribosome small subunit-dependent GTPase A [Planctomycetaceae bacterium]
MAKDKQKKVRTEFRKHYGARTRHSDVTRQFRADESSDDQRSHERLSGRGDLVKSRVVRGVAATADESGQSIVLDVSGDQCLSGQVLRVHGLNSIVRIEGGVDIVCSTRGLLKTLGTDLRHVVVAGDLVMVKLSAPDRGVIQRVEPRRGCISRTSRNRQHLIAANIHQCLIVTSCAEPGIKPNLIDRFLVTAEKSGVRPLIVLNKIDLVDPADLQPTIGNFAQLGYEVLAISATKGWGIDLLRRSLQNRRTVVVGQSGVGKSSLLNAIEPGLALRVSHVSQENQKGRHTTTTAQLIPLQLGGYVLDTPGIRQFQLWDLVPAEASQWFREFRAWADRCRFPNCSHTHEQDCAVKSAVADGRISLRRYDSYCQIFAGDLL